MSWGVKEETLNTKPMRTVRLAWTQNITASLFIFIFSHFTYKLRTYERPKNQFRALKRCFMGSFCGAPPVRWGQQRPFRRSSGCFGGSIQHGKPLKLFSGSDRQPLSSDSGPETCRSSTLTMLPVSLSAAKGDVTVYVSKLALAVSCSGLPGSVAGRSLGSVRSGDRVHGYSVTSDRVTRLWSTSLLLKEYFHQYIQYILILWYCVCHIYFKILEPFMNQKEADDFIVILSWFFFSLIK